MKRWYVAMTHTKSEEVARINLARQGFRAYLPRYLKERRHARKTTEVRAPLFPGYIFVNIDMDAERWRPIRSTIGVRDLISFGELPTAVPAGIVEEIQRREDEAGIVPDSAGTAGPAGSAADQARRGAELYLGSLRVLDLRR
jgi:transcriptional antiterminator RfaH